MSVRLSVTPCNSLRPTNRCYRVQCEGQRYAAVVISKQPTSSTAAYIQPVIPDALLHSPDNNLTLDAYLNELLTLAHRQPQHSLLLDEADVAAGRDREAGSGNGSGSGIPKPLVRQDSKRSNRSDDSPALFSSTPAAAIRQLIPPLSHSHSNHTLQLPNNSPRVAVSSPSSAASVSQHSLTPIALPAAAAPPPAFSFTPPPTLALNQAANGTDKTGDDAVQLITGPDACRDFLTAYLDVLYTARQGRSASLSAAADDDNTALASLTTSSASSVATTTPNRRHLRSIHPNLPAIDEVIETDVAFVLLSKYFPRSLAACLRQSGLSGESDESRLLIVYQLLQCVSFLHNRHIVHGRLSTSNLMLTGNHWLYVTSLHCPATLPRPLSPTSTTESALLRWVRGDLSNYDYLMELNRLAGREMSSSDVALHPILPWVVDFTSAEGGWRDLSRSKFRLKKGDDQLDFTYLNSASSNSPPHHITEQFSDLTYYVYLARISPLTTLKRVVRERFVPAEYPPSLQRIYAWTPDECIPEFYTDPSILCSRHRELGLDDLAVPAWCESQERFVAWHRQRLESEEVSARLNEWIDITFGHKLSGQAAIEAKNVPLWTGNGGGAKGVSKRSAFVQLFDRAHPKRMSGTGGRGDSVRGMDGISQGKGVEEEKRAASDAPELQNGEESKTLDDDGDRSVHLNGDSVNGSPTGGNYSEADDVIIRNLQLLQEAAAFDADFTALEGCYDPIDELPNSEKPAYSGEEDENDEDDEDQDDEPFNRPATSPPPAVVLPSDLYTDDELTPIVFRPPAPEMSSLSGADTLTVLQAGDIFSAGCICAELFLSRPLFSRHTHRLYALGEYSPSLSSLPVPVARLVRSMVDRDPFKRPTAAALLHSEIFTAAGDASYEQVYNYISELRRQQGLFPHSHPTSSAPHAPPSPPPPSAAAPCASSSTSSTVPSSSAAVPSSNTLCPPPPSWLSSSFVPSSSSFVIPSDDVHTPPIPRSALLDMNMITPPEFSPLTAMLDKEREERERQEEERDEREEDEDELDDEVGDEEEEQQEEGNSGSTADGQAETTSGALSSTAAALFTRQQLTMDWAMDQLESLASMPLSLYLPLLPPTLSLTSHPELRISSIALITLLAAKLGPTLSSKHLFPPLHSLVLHIHDVELQRALLSLDTLLSVYNYFSYQGGARDFLSYARNCLLSPDSRISDAAATSLYSFLIDHLDLSDNMDQELAVRDLLLPMLSRIGRPASERIVRLLLRLIPECPPTLIVRFFYPHTVQLLEKGASSASEFSRAELEMKLTCGLELMYAMLPDLPLSTLQHLINDTNAVKPLLNGTVRGPLTVPNLRRLLQLLLYTVVEFTGENEHIKLNEHTGSTSAIDLKNFRLVLPLLPLLAEFMTSTATRVETLKLSSVASDGTGRGGVAGGVEYSAWQCYEFVQYLYVGLAVAVGTTVLRKAVSSHQRIEQLLAAGKPQAPGKKTRSVAGHRASAVVAANSAGSVDLTRSADVDAVVKHGVLGKVKRGGWEEREDKRSAARRERRLKEREAEGEVTSAGMHEVHENWMSSVDDKARKSSADTEGDELASDDETATEDEKFVKINRPPSIAAPRTIAATNNSRPSGAPLTVAMSPADQRKSSPFFSFLSASPTADSLAQSMDMTELWNVDLSTPYKYRGQVKHTLNAHSPAAVSSLAAHSSRLLFLSASRDDVVKLWSIGLGTGGLHCGQVYRGHRGRGGVSDVRLLGGENDDVVSRWAGSLDVGGSVHVWDIETAVCMWQSPFGGKRVAGVSRDSAASTASFASPSSASASAPSSTSAAAAAAAATQRGDQFVTSFMRGDEHSVLLGTAVATVRHLDMRSGQLSGCWRHLGSAQPLASVRCMCRGPAATDTKEIAARGRSSESGMESGSWLATGLSTGEVTVFDERTGIIRLQWRAHESAVLSLHAVDAHHVLSSGADKTICVWEIRTDEPALVQRFAALDDSVKAAVLHGSDLLCVMGSKVGVGQIVTEEAVGGATMSSVGGADKKRATSKLTMMTMKGNKSKGHFTSITMLPQYRVVLLGCDDGKLLLTV